ncbi:MAG: ABC transporter permease [Actinomycetota bacterium]
MSWQRIRAIARRQRYVVQRSPHRSFDLTVWPLVDTMLFGSIAAYIAGNGAKDSGAARTAAYLIVGTVLWHVVYQSQIALSTGFLEETWSRNLLNLMVTPLRELEFVAGVALFSLVKSVIGVGVVALTVAALYSFSVPALGFGLVPIFALLTIVGWAIAMFVIGLVLRFGMGAEALAWGIMFVVMPLSGAFVPISSLPRFVRPLSQILPTTHAFAAGRSLVDGDGTDWYQLRLATVATIGTVALSAWFLTAMLRLFRRRGYVTRFS